MKYGKIDQVKVVHEHRKNGQEKNYAFVLFKGKESMSKVFEDGEVHFVSGFRIECKPTLLRDELKQIHLEKLKKEGVAEKKEEEKKKKKKRKNKKKEAKKTGKKGKGRNFRFEEEEDEADVYVKKSDFSSKKKMGKEIKLPEKQKSQIESCWNAESSGLQSQITPSILEHDTVPKRAVVNPSRWEDNSDKKALSNRVSLDAIQTEPVRQPTPFDEKELNGNKRISMGTTNPSERTAPTIHNHPQQSTNQSNPFLQVTSVDSGNFSQNNPFQQQQPTINHNYYPSFEAQGPQNTNQLFNYYQEDNLSKAFNQPLVPAYPEQSSLQVPEDTRYRRRGNAILWNSDLVDSVNKYAASYGEQMSASGNRNTGYSKQGSAHPGFNMYRMLPYETKSEAAQRGSRFSGMTYQERSQSDLIRMQENGPGMSGFNIGNVNTNYMAMHQGGYSSYRNTDPTSMGNAGGFGQMGQAAENERKTTSDFYYMQKNEQMMAAGLQSGQQVRVVLTVRGG